MTTTQLIKKAKKLHPDVFKQIGKTQYRMPDKYISWEKLSGDVFISLLFQLGKCTEVDPVASQFLVILSRFYFRKLPLYCISQDLIDFLDETDAEKDGIFLKWEPPVPGFIVAIPFNSGQFSNTPIGTITYLAVVIEDIGSDGYYIGWGTKGKGLDGAEAAWVSGMIIDSNGNVSRANDSFSGSENITKSESNCLYTIDNLILNILLLLSTPSELSDELVEPSSMFKKGVGFSSTKNKKDEAILYPRWLDLKKEVKSANTKEKKTESSIHSSPITHWRRGHWRTLQPGEGKKWKEIKRIWIKPQLINHHENSN